MNREQRRNMMKKIPKYRNLLEKSSEKAVDKLEKMFQKAWDNDDTLNEGEYDSYENESDEDLND